jgi:hypothetical protein
VHAITLMGLKRSECRLAELWSTSGSDWHSAWPYFAPNRTYGCFCQYASVQRAGLLASGARSSHVVRAVHVNATFAAVRSTGLNGVGWDLKAISLPIQPKIVLFIADFRVAWPARGCRRSTLAPCSTMQRVEQRVGRTGCA